MRIIFVSFGNRNYFNELLRIKKEIESFNYFDEIKLFTEEDLKKDKNFWGKHKFFIENNNRGYGYWLWKPYLLLKVLNNINYNDIIIYADAGCSFNSNGINRLKEYINLVQNNISGNLSYELEHNEEKYTKNDLFNYLECDKDEFRNSKQLVGGIFILKKCKNTINIFNKWYKTAQNYHLVDDTPSKTKNCNIFIEHRHDQSIFSLLRKKYGTIIIKDETDRHKWDKNEYSKFPIYRKFT